jgi:oxygen-dependent protoporphyrinogen oxidase
VIGGGISGLACAHALAVEHGAAVELFEASASVGGKMRTSPFAGLPAVDEGPDAFLARVPGASTLARAVGLGDSLVAPQSGTAAVWWNGLHQIPAGLMLGMPTGVAALSRTRLLTWRGKARAALEPLLPTTSLSGDSLGAFVRARFGDEVHERLVDPLVGSIYATDTDRFSLAAVSQVADLAASGRSVLVAGRRRRQAPVDRSPVFLAPATGLGSMATAVADAIVRAGGAVYRSAPVEALSASAKGWHLDGVDAGPFDAVVVATPPSAASRLLATSGAVDSASGTASIDTADVVIVTIAVDSRHWPPHLAGLSGYLVPKPVQALVTAVSFGSQKWAHWASGDSVILRISLGRDGLPVLHLDDARLVDAAVTEAGVHLGLDLQPTAVRVSRWPGAFPQYRPHHAARVAEIRRHLPAGIAVAGAAFDGIGIPACVRSGLAAAARVGT